MDDALKVFASRLSHPAFFSGGSVAVSSLTGSADAFAALALSAAFSPRVVVAVTEGLPSADRLFDDLSLLASSREISRLAYQVRIAEFPPLVQGEKSSLGARAKTLAALKAWTLNPYPLVVVVPFASLSRPIAVSSLPSLRLAEGASRFSEVVAKIAELGYERISMVEKEGDWSQRGGIVDVWSPGDDFPVRCEFFGEELESIRTFNAATQRSLQRIQSAEIISVKDDRQTQEEPSYLTDFLPCGIFDDSAVPCGLLLRKWHRRLRQCQGLAVHIRALHRICSCPHLGEALA
jgi:transcription-repair coupling factor (superfamily II helicase)